jgi:hypothetical protein
MTGESGSENNLSPNLGFFELMTGTGRPIVIFKFKPSICDIVYRMVHGYLFPSYTSKVLQLLYTVPVYTFSKPFTTSFLLGSVQVPNPDPKKDLETLFCIY